MIKLKKMLSSIVGISFILSFTQLNKINKVRSLDFLFDLSKHNVRIKNIKHLSYDHPYKYAEVREQIIDDFNNFFEYFIKDNSSGDSPFEYFKVRNCIYEGINYSNTLSSTQSGYYNVFNFENDGFDNKIEIDYQSVIDSMFVIDGYDNLVPNINKIFNNIFTCNCYPHNGCNNNYVYDIMNKDQVNHEFRLKNNVSHNKIFVKFNSINDFFGCSLKINNIRDWEKFVTNMPRIFKFVQIQKNTLFANLQFYSARGIKETAIFKYIRAVMVANKCSFEEIVNDKTFMRYIDSCFGYVHIVKSELEAAILDAPKKLPIKNLPIIGNTISNFFNGNELCSDILETKNYGVKPSENIFKIYERNCDPFLKIKNKFIKTIPWAIGSIFSYSLIKQLTKGFNKLIKLLFIQSTNAVSERFLMERNSLINDPVKLCKKIKEMIKDGIVGLEKEIEKLTELASGNLALEKSPDLFNKNFCQLIALIGSPGVGKSMLARKYALAITGKPLPDWGYIPASAIKKGQNAEEQIFHYNSNLVKNLTLCGGNTVVFFDEIDKYESNGLLDFLRDLLERGTFTIIFPNGPKTIKVPRLIVIVGTNEKAECWGLPPEPDLPEYTEGRTIVNRSISICQRFHRFLFSPYKIEEYQQMYENSIKIIEKDSKKMFGFRLQFKYGISERLAMESKLLNMGARSVPCLLTILAGAVTRHDIEIHPEKSLGFFSKVFNFFTKKPEPDVKKQLIQEKGLLVDFDNGSHNFTFENKLFDINEDKIDTKKKVVSTISDKQTKHEMNKQELLIDNMEDKKNN